MSTAPPETSSAIGIPAQTAVAAGLAGSLTTQAFTGSAAAVTAPASVVLDPRPNEAGHQNGMASPTELVGRQRDVRHLTSAAAVAAVDVSPAGASAATAAATTTAASHVQLEPTSPHVKLEPTSPLLQPSTAGYMFMKTSSPRSTAYQTSVEKRQPTTARWLKIPKLRSKRRKRWVCMSRC